VYTYDTSGYEETDALGGTRHTYPAQTTVTVQAAGCGWSLRWQPLEERWDELRLCDEADGRALISITTFHEFFRRTQRQDNECPPGSVYSPASAEPGWATTFTCSGSFGSVAFATQVIESEEVLVAGAPITGLLIHYDVQFSGSNRGAGAFDEWVDARGVVLKRVWDLDVETDSPFGTVHYAEHYSITLSSPDPMQ
jgi:hypothetical protein